MCWKEIHSDTSSYRLTSWIYSLFLIHRYFFFLLQFQRSGSLHVSSMYSVFNSRILKSYSYAYHLSLSIFSLQSHRTHSFQKDLGQHSFTLQHLQCLFYASIIYLDYFICILLSVKAWHPLIFSMLFKNLHAIMFTFHAVNFFEFYKMQSPMESLKWNIFTASGNLHIGCSFLSENFNQLHNFVPCRMWCN